MQARAGNPRLAQPLVAEGRRGCGRGALPRSVVPAPAAV